MGCSCSRRALGENSYGPGRARATAAGCTRTRAWVTERAALAWAGLPGELDRGRPQQAHLLQIATQRRALRVGHLTQWQAHRAGRQAQQLAPQLDVGNGDHPSLAPGRADPPLVELPN